MGHFRGRKGELWKRFFYGTVINRKEARPLALPETKALESAMALSGMGFPHTGASLSRGKYKDGHTARKEEL